MGKGNSSSSRNGKDRGEEARARLHGTERNRNPGLIYSYRKIEFPLHLKHFFLIFEEILTAISSFSSRHVAVEVSRKRKTTFLLITNPTLTYKQKIVNIGAGSTGTGNITKLFRKSLCMELNGTKVRWKGGEPCLHPRKIHLEHNEPIYGRYMALLKGSMSIYLFLMSSIIFVLWLWIVPCQ